MKDNSNMLLRFKYAIYGMVSTFIVLVGYLLIAQSTTGIAFALETVGTEFGISTFPNSFLQVNNIAPGAKYSAEMTVKNEGQHDFSYDISATKESGADLLYNILNLDIVDGNNRTLYTGKLKDLSNTALGVLAKGSQDVLKFTVEFPKEAGNEYQGLSTSSTFTLTAKEHPPTLTGNGVIWDPPLEKPDVDVRCGRIMPIKFHLVNSDGTLDTQKRGVDLLVSGVNEAGNSVEYRFSVPDGTLEWEGSLEKPHYSLLFDTEKYPEKAGTYYTVKAMYGEQVLGSTTFINGK